MRAWWNIQSNFLRKLVSSLVFLCQILQDSDDSDLYQHYIQVRYELPEFCTGVSEKQQNTKSYYRTLTAVTFNTALVSISFNDLWQLFQLLETSQGQSHYVGKYSTSHTINGTINSHSRLTGLILHLLWHSNQGTTCSHWLSCKLYIHRQVPRWETK